MVPLIPEIQAYGVNATRHDSAPSADWAAAPREAQASRPTASATRCTRPITARSALSRSRAGVGELLHECLRRGLRRRGVLPGHQVAVGDSVRLPIAGLGELPAALLQHV